MEFLKKKHRDSKLFQSYSSLFLMFVLLSIPMCWRWKDWWPPAGLDSFFCHQKSNGNVKLGGGGGGQWRGLSGDREDGGCGNKENDPQHSMNVSSQPFWVSLFFSCCSLVTFILIIIFIYLFIYFIFPVLPSVRDRCAVVKCHTGDQRVAGSIPSRISRIVFNLGVIFLCWPFLGVSVPPPWCCSIIQ